jgi:hypothetical protein
MNNGSKKMKHHSHVVWQIDSLTHVELHLFYNTAFFWGGGGFRPFPTLIAHTITLISKVTQTIT